MTKKTGIDTSTGRDGGKLMPGSNEAKELGRKHGRKRGQKNKDTKLLRYRLTQLVESYGIEQMKIDLMELTPFERLRTIGMLSEFLIPKLNRTDHRLEAESDGVIVIMPGEKRTKRSEQITEDIEAQIVNHGDRFIERGNIQPDLFTSLEGPE